jgi:hypothetical protein
MLEAIRSTVSCGDEHVLNTCVERERTALSPRVEFFLPETC